MAITARGLDVHLGARQVLHGIDIEVRPGELFGLLGPNGAGKTTLLRALAGLVPAKGTITHDGAASLSRPEMARRIAFLAQGGEAAWPLSAEAVVALGRLPHRKPFGGETEADRQAVARVLALCEAAEFAARPVGTLSGGERRRVLLARALAVEAPYLLADEPLAALDPLHQLEVMGLLQGIARDGTGVVVILHDLSLAARFCDRVALLHEGRLAAEGPPATVLNDERLAAVFGIRAARGHHEGQGFLLPWHASKRSAP